MRAKRARTSAVRRTPEQIEECAREWVKAKFRSAAKERARERLWPGVDWSCHLVHAVVREPAELSVFEGEGVICHSFADLLADLSRRGSAFSGSAGGDLAEIVSYYSSARIGDPANMGPITAI